MKNKEKKPLKKQRVVAIVLAVVMVIATLASTFVAVVYAAEGSEESTVPQVTPGVTPGVTTKPKETETKTKENIMKGFSNFTYKSYEWPNNLTVGKIAFDIVEDVYNISTGKKNKLILWNDKPMKESMLHFYNNTDWHQFSGMQETVELTNICSAVLTEEVAQYAPLMDYAAEINGIGVYKEIFKAIAQARFNEHEDLYKMLDKNGSIKGVGTDQFDLFHIDGSWIDGGHNPVEEEKGLEQNKENNILDRPFEEIYTMNKFSVQQSIDIAAKAFADIVKEAVFPSPYNTDDLMGAVQSFEFGGQSNSIKSQYMSSPSKLSGVTGFVIFDYYLNSEVSKLKAEAEKEYNNGDGKDEPFDSDNVDIDYDEIIEKYAKVIAHNEKRTEEDKYGKYKYSDQKFYQKVFENYRCAGGGNIEMGQLPEEMKEILRQCMKGWDSRVTKERMAIIEAGCSLYGVTYAYNNEGHPNDPPRNSPSVENPLYLDCSSFVGQCYWRANILDKSATGWATGTFAANFQQIDEGQLIPGDIAQITWTPGGSGINEHIGIYIGKIGDTKYYIHCASSSGGINGRDPGKGVRIDSFPGFIYFGKHPDL